MCEKAWQVISEQNFYMVSAFLEAHAAEYAPNQKDDLYDALVYTLIRVSRSSDSGTEEGFRERLESAFLKALRRFQRHGQNNGFQIISLSDPSLRRYTTMGIEQSYEEVDDAGETIRAA